MTPARDDRNDDENEPLLVQFAKVIGEENAVRLSARFGGRALYIPLDPTDVRTASRVNELVQTIGLHAAQLLARRFGGVTFEMPLEAGKRQRILVLSASGQYTTGEIARLVGCTERHVYSVRAQHRASGGELLDLGPRPDPLQADLFGASDATAPASDANPTSPSEDE